MQGQRRMSALGEAEDEELAVLPGLQIGEDLLRRRQQVDRGGRLGGRVEIAMARDRRAAQTEIVRRDVDEAVSGEDRRGRRSLEALAPRVEIAEGVRVRRDVVEGNRGAVHVGHGRERSGFARHRHHAGDGGRPREGLSRQHRVIRAVGHLVAVEAVLECDGEVLGKLEEVLIESNPLLEVCAGVVRRRIRAHFLVADQSPPVALLAGTVDRCRGIDVGGSGPGQRHRARELRDQLHHVRRALFHVTPPMRSAVVAARSLNR